MTPEKVREALGACATMLLEHDSHAFKVPAGAPNSTLEEKCDHALAMCFEAATFPDEGVEKMMRWLGFIQGVIWSADLTSIGVLKRMNMPDEEKTDE